VRYLPDFLDNGGAAVLTLVVAGGLLYSAGAIVYALKRPDPSPDWFGFHEVFHALTVAAFTAHYIAISLATY
ncbi:hemolysin III family protein, partial [Streptomyces sp. NPDC127574]